MVQVFNSCEDSYRVPVVRTLYFFTLNPFVAVGHGPELTTPKTHSFCCAFFGQIPIATPKRIERVRIYSYSITLDVINLYKFRLLMITTHSMFSLLMSLQEIAILGATSNPDSPARPWLPTSECHRHRSCDRLKA